MKSTEIRRFIILIGSVLLIFVVVGCEYDNREPLYKHDNPIINQEENEADDISIDVNPDYLLYDPVEDDAFHDVRFDDLEVLQKEQIILTLDTFLKYVYRYNYALSKSDDIDKQKEVLTPTLFDSIKNNKRFSSLIEDVVDYKIDLNINSLAVCNQIKTDNSGHLRILAMINWFVHGADKEGFNAKHPALVGGYNNYDLIIYLTENEDQLSIYKWYEISRDPEQIIKYDENGVEYMKTVNEEIQ